MTSDRLIAAVQSATQKLASSTGSFNVLIKDVLKICMEAVGASGGTIYLHDEEAHRLRFQHVLPEEIAARLPAKDIAEDFGMAGQAFVLRQTLCRDFPPKPDNERNEFERATGVTVRSMVAAPLKLEGEPPIGVVQLLNKDEGVFNETDCAVLDIVAAVATMAYVNFQLSEEANKASSLLGMGKVSHDIGNLAAALYANLSFSEMAVNGLKSHLLEGKPDDTTLMYVDTIEPMFVDLRFSVDRIVGYSRLISDISAGRELRPEMVLAPLADTIQTSAAYLELEGRANHVGIRYEIAADAPPTMHDPLYIFRIVQNLVGNAVKAVKETIPDDWHSLGPDDSTVLGEVLVRYRFDGENHILEVRDSGPGITPEIAAKILSGNARSQWDKASGSGWGTRIVLELAATHGGKVSIDSQLGRGTTFRVTLPHHPA